MAKRSGLYDFLIDAGVGGAVLVFAVSYADMFAEIGVAHEDWVTVCTGIAAFTGFVAALLSSFGYLMYENWTLKRCTRLAFHMMWVSAVIYALVWLVAKYAPIDTPTSTSRSDTLAGPVSAFFYVVMVTTFIGWAAGIGKQIRSADTSGNGIPPGGQT